MNTTRFEVPLTLPTPHFDDERTVATARRVRPIGRAKVTEGWRKLRTLFPLILLATCCGAIGAAGVNYYEGRHRVNAVAPPVTNDSAVQPKVESLPIAVAASASATPNAAEKDTPAVEPKAEASTADVPETKTVTPTAPSEPSDKPAANAEKKATEADATKLTRKRRVNSPDEDGASSKRKGAGRITDIFSGPNPF